MLKSHHVTFFPKGYGSGINAPGKIELLEIMKNRFNFTTMQLLQDAMALELILTKPAII